MKARDETALPSGLLLHYFPSTFCAVQFVHAVSGRRKDQNTSYRRYERTCNKALHGCTSTATMARLSSSSALLQTCLALLVLAICASHVSAFNPLGRQEVQQHKNKQPAQAQVAVEDADGDAFLSSRRSFFATAVMTASSALLFSQEASAKEVDCFQDCFKNCKLIAPKDQQYCLDTCKEYCDQTDRRDGLSGSVSSEGGETGILGLNTVVKGEDKPPEIKIPGLDFSSGKGKKLIGY